MLSTSKPSELTRLDKAMLDAGSYKEWKALALEHDYTSGRETWKRTEKSNSYDYANIRSRLNMLQDLRQREDFSGLLFALNEGIHGNQGGMGRAAVNHHRTKDVKMFEFEMHRVLYDIRKWNIWTL